MIDVLIINYNRITLPSKMADWLSARGCNVIFIDNNSEYPSLIEYYKNCNYKVLRLPYNYGHTVIWNYPVLDKLGINGRYILTDPDLDLTGIPDDFLSVLHAGLDKYPQFIKCAFSLEINDLPDNEEGRYLKNGTEAPYWTNPLDPMYFDAITDTTFALYRGRCEYTHSAIRTNRPYTARHIPWYYTDFNKLPEDEKYYYIKANKSCSHKDRFIKC